MLTVRYIMPCRDLLCTYLLYVYGCSRMGLIYTMRGLSALSVSTIWAMREPRAVGWAKANPTLYFCRGMLTFTIIGGDRGTIRTKRQSRNV